MNASALILLTVISCTAGTPQASPSSWGRFTVVSWNTTSIRPDPHVAALRIATMEGADLWALAGVRDARWAELFREAAAEGKRREMASLLSPTVGSDRLLILYDLGRFELLRHLELGWQGEPWHRSGVFLRPALIAQLRHFGTGQEFLFMVNNLHPKWSAQQADKIARWTQAQGLPVIAVGTYHFQYNLGPEPLQCDGQAGLLTLLSGGLFQWVNPVHSVRTYHSPFNTIEDFVFLANAAGRIYGQSEIVVEPGDFAGPEPTGAHRPIRTLFTILPAPDETQLRRRIREQALKIKTELDVLDALIRQLPE
jgi:hypothetical protein